MIYVVAEVVENIKSVVETNQKNREPHGLRLVLESEIWANRSIPFSALNNTYHFPF